MVYISTNANADNTSVVNKDSKITSNNNKLLPLIIDNNNVDINKKINKINRATENNKIEHQSVYSQSYGIHLDAADEVLYTDTYTITGVLQDAFGNKWSNEIVYLYVDTVHVDNATTDANGVYTFLLTFTVADLGLHDYRVYFPNLTNNPLRTAGDAKYGSYHVKQNVVVTSYLDRTVVTPTQNYNITVTAIADNGTDIDPNSAGGLGVNYAITYDVNTQTESIDRSFSGGKAELIHSYIDPAATKNDQIHVTISMTGTANFPNYIFTITPPATRDIFVSVEIAFSMDQKINGATINPNTRYYRSGQTIFINGTLSAQNSSLIVNKAFDISITGGGFSKSNPIYSGVTNTTGEFQYQFNLNVTAFPDPTTDITVTVAFATTSTITPQQRQFTIKMKEDIATIDGVTTDISLNGTQHSTDAFFPQSGSITIQGHVTDVNSANAKQAEVMIQFNDKDTVNIPWAGHGNLVGSEVYAITDSSGNFVVSFTVPDFGVSFPWITVNITLSANNEIWQNPNNVSVEPFTFKYFRSIQTFVTEDSSGSNTTINNGDSNVYDVFNETFYTYTSPVQATGAEYYITIQDEYARIAPGISVTVNILGYNAAGTALISYTLNYIVEEGVGKNNGQFMVSFNNLRNDSDFTQLINSEGSYFVFKIIIANDNNGIATETRTETFYSYGPDDTPPSIYNVATTGADSGKEDNITITVTLDYTRSKVDNIRNVTLYYRYSDNLVANESDAVFTSAYTVISMTYDPVTQKFGYTILFNGHGRWVQWYIIAFDLAGYGLDQYGNTVAPGSYPNYDNSKTLTDNYGSETSPQISKMGDTDIGTPDLTTDLYINNKVITESTNQTLGNDILIQLNLPTDMSGYDYVQIYIKFIYWAPLYSEIINQTGWYIFNMTGGLEVVINGVLKVQYAYIISGNNGNITWFTQLDYYFNYTDNAGNNAYTSSILQLIDSQGANIPDTWVDDEEAPTGNFNNTAFNYPKAGRDNIVDNQTYVAYTNETSLVRIIYNVTDTGSGLYYINATIFGTFDNGTITKYNITFVDAGEIVYTTLGLNAPVGSFYIVNFTIPESFFVDGALVTWEVYVYDRAGHLTVFNRRVDNGVSLNINNPPVISKPPNDSSIIVTTDESGNVITITTTTQKSNNIIWIIIGFILGLSLLVLYYQRRNIMEYFARGKRKKQVEEKLSSVFDEINRLGTEGKYRKAILLTWKALEEISDTVIHAGRKFNQTAQEYAAYLSTVTIIESETLFTLSEIFEKARYGKEEPTLDDWDDAVKALQIAVQTIITSGARVEIDEDEDFD